MCPHCGREAPIVYRGLIPLCTACGRLRAPLSGPSINLAGKPSEVSGAVAGIAGLLVLVFGLSLTAIIFGLLHLLATTWVALVVGAPIAAVTLVVGLLLLLSGRALRRSGAAAQQAAYHEALLGLTDEKGAISAAEGARALGLSVRDTDVLLTELAKRQPDRLAVEVDEQGGVWYRRVPDERARVEGPSPSSALRVDVAAAEPAEAEHAPAERAGWVRR